jgi:hypothetical protein
LAICRGDVPAEVHAERAAMTRHPVTQMTAERERSLAENEPTWTKTADEIL